MLLYLYSLMACAALIADLEFKVAFNRDVDGQKLVDLTIELLAKHLEVVPKH